MRFSRFWCKQIIQSNVFHFIILRWDPSTHPWGHNPKSIVEIHGPYIYICFLLIGIVGSYMFDMFFVCNPGTKPGGHFQRNGVAFLFARNDGVDTGRAANLPCAKTANPTGKMVSGPPLQIASCWWMKKFIEKQFASHTLLETKTLSLKSEGWNMKFPFGRQFRPIFRDYLRFMEVALLTKCLMFLFKVHPAYESTMFQ